MILSLAKKYNATPTQVILSWHIARETPIVVKSVDKERQKENFAVCAMFSWIGLDDAELFLVGDKSGLGGCDESFMLGPRPADLCSNRGEWMECVWMECRATWVVDYMT